MDAQGNLKDKNAVGVDDDEPGGAGGVLRTPTGPVRID